jgi:hypothetical protein
MEQIMLWMHAEKLYNPRIPDAVVDFPVRELDLDFDGINDVLIDRQTGGQSGGVHSAFLSTSRGFRFIGTFFGTIRPLRVEPGQRIRFVIGSAMGSDRSHVRLAESRADGLHQLATAILAAGDSGTAEGNRVYRELMSAEVVSAEILRLVFGLAILPASGGRASTRTRRTSSHDDGNFVAEERHPCEGK